MGLAERIMRELSATAPRKPLTQEHKKKISEGLVRFHEVHQHLTKTGWKMDKGSDKGDDKSYHHSHHGQVKFRVIHPDVDKGPTSPAATESLDLPSSGSVQRFEHLRSPASSISGVKSTNTPDTRGYHKSYPANRIKDFTEEPGYREFDHRMADMVGRTHKRS